MRYPKVLYVAAIKLILITSVALLMATMVACDTGQSGQKSALKKSIANTAQESVDKQVEQEDAYLAELRLVMDIFFANRDSYNSALVRIGEEGSKTKSDQEYGEVIEDLVEMLEYKAAEFKQNSDDVRSIMPAPRYKEFHLLLADAVSEMSQVTQSFVTLYSMSLNGVSIDEASISRAQALLKSANEKSLRAGYMYKELCPECD